MAFKENISQTAPITNERRGPSIPSIRNSDIKPAIPMKEDKSVKILRKSISGSPGRGNLINANNIFESQPIPGNVNNNEWEQSGMLQNKTLEQIRKLIHKNNLWGQNAIGY